MSDTYGVARRLQILNNKTKRLKLIRSEIEKV
jgi:hypothetical protein